MGNSYDKHPSATARTPAQWTDQVQHKYCGALDKGRIGKPNKAHRCEACLAIKAQQSKIRNGPNDIKAGREEKWHSKFQLCDESVPDAPGRAWKKK